ncbi:SWIRM domain-containing protein [Polychytrium aggregatum]|uniref:SWIRM domain-containing protein n=1 Tax=Polychytrium aggregatum TaxID=110093 RepID=UPI0022FDBDA6|nr:SWIRM domain-containing protein [Polychytrium aggregatum]KAI9205928.1 SWIRM domain-containing protein [Polychytrium aggregatum]
MSPREDTNPSSPAEDDPMEDVSPTHDDGGDDPVHPPSSRRATRSHRRSDGDADGDDAYGGDNGDEHTGKNGPNGASHPDGKQGDIEGDEDGDGVDADNAMTGDVNGADPSSKDADPSANGSFKVRLVDPSEAATSAPKAALVPQLHEIIIPSYAAWFSLSRIDDIERKALPEFFNGRNKSKTPMIYKDYRDFMVNASRLNPTEYLTVTACRRNLAGDVCAIIRVHAFLEQWGLINYQADPESRPVNLAPSFTGHFRVTAETPRGLQPFAPYAPISKAVPEGANKPKAAAEESLRTAGLAKNSFESIPAKRKSETGDESATPGAGAGSAGEAKRSKHSCTTCGSDCTRVRYHNTKTPSLDVCSSCYLEGRFTSTAVSSEFVKLEDRRSDGEPLDEWTDQEVLLLLEGLELYDEDWNKIAEHVGTKTRSQCVLKFIGLPIEDPYNNVKMSELGPLQYQRVPVGPADNPVLSLTAFLASTVNPQVVAAAAQRASVTATASAASGKENLEKAATVALSAAAVKAKMLSEQQEREATRSIIQLIELQAKKMEQKLKHFEELEAILEQERREIEKERHQLFIDRLALKRAQLQHEAQVQAHARSASHHHQSSAGVATAGHASVSAGAVAGSGANVEADHDASAPAKDAGAAANGPETFVPEYVAGSATSADAIDQQPIEVPSPSKSTLISL